MTTWIGLIGQLPSPGGFVHPVKVGAVFVVFFTWLFAAQWVSRDTQRLKFNRLEMWQGLVLGGGALGMVAWLLVPWKGGLFVVGGLVWLLIAGGATVAYVLYRNHEVVDSAKVLTPAHLKRMVASLGKSKAEKAEAVEKVKLTNSEGKSVKPPENDPDGVEEFIVAQDFLFDCLWKRASEVNLVAQGDNVRIAFRIDGAVSEQEPLSGESAERLLRFMRQISGQDPEEHRRPQTGTITAAMAGTGGKGKVEINVRTEGSTAGQRLYLRVITEEARFRLSEVGLTRDQLKTVKSLIAQPKGLVIFAAPKRNGLTSTLYAALRGHDAFIQHLHTLERSPLMDLENVTQNIHDPNESGTTYGQQLGTILRRQPDVLMIESCDDEETASNIASASTRDRKLYLGIVAEDTFAGLNHYLSKVGDRNAAAEGTLAVVCQRLIRKLCPACKQAYHPDPNVLRKANLNVPADQLFYQPPEPEVDKKGNPIICPSCQGIGYFGRTGVFEILPIDDVIREMIKGNASIHAIRDQARKNQMRYIWEEGLEKVKEGVTSMNEILRVLRPGSKSKKK